MKCLSVLAAVLVSACTAAPLTAPTPPSVAAVVSVPIPTIPFYVVIGDSLGLGAYFPIVEGSLTRHRWQSAAIGSTFIHTQWQPEGTAFHALRASVTETPTAFLMHIGANDTVLQPPPTRDSVFADLTRFVDALQQAYAGSILYLSDVGQVWTYGDKRTENAEVRAAIERAWRELPHVKQGPMLRDLTPDDGVHFTSPQNVQAIAERWIAVMH